MKLHHIFAAVATASILVSCSKTEESYVEDECALKMEAAEILLNCHTWDDAFDAADELHAIADKIKELREEQKRNAYEIEEAELSMTLAEHKEAADRIKNLRNEANDKLKRAKEHIHGNDAGNSSYLQFAVDRVRH